MSIITKTCSIENCNDKNHARNWCLKHYAVWLRTGNPLPINYHEWHGGTNTPEHNIWKAMKQRCNNPKDKGYGNYGGRGITICDRWLHSFQNFIDDMGYRPSDRHSIERINNNLGYSPSNCKWATAKEQASNKRPWGTTTRLRSEESSGDI